MLRKKIMTCLLAALLLVQPAVSVSAAIPDAASGGVASFAVSADSARTEAVQVTDAAKRAALEGILSSADTASPAPAAASEIATLTLNGTDTYSVRVDGADMYLHAAGEAYRIDAQDFYDLLSGLGGFYKHRALPVAALPGGALNAAVQSSTYNFQKLDGLFYRTQFTKASPPTVMPADGGFPVPAITPAPSSASVVASTLTGGGDIDEDVFTGTLSQLAAWDSAPDANVYVSVTASYDTAYYKGHVEYAYIVSSNAAGDGTFSVEGSNTYPGEMLVLRASGLPSSAQITVSSNIDFTPSFYDDGKGGKIALMPISYVSSPGTYYIEMSAPGSSQRFSITANNKTFQVQNLTVPASTTEQTIQSQKANDEFNNTILPLRWDDDARQHWEGKFILPVQGARVTTQFGCIRYTNGSPNASRHGGVDLAVATGTRIGATNAGRVVYAGYLQLTGYTILIEHGYGLKSWYYHMNSINVKTGDIVEKNQKIGEVGTTGFSTGPHLHFATSVNNVFINPYTLIETDLVA